MADIRCSPNGGTPRQAGKRSRPWRASRSPNWPAGRSRGTAADGNYSARQAHAKSPRVIKEPAPRRRVVPGGRIEPPSRSPGPGSQPPPKFPAAAPSTPPRTAVPPATLDPDHLAATGLQDAPSGAAGWLNPKQQPPSRWAAVRAPLFGFRSLRVSRRRFGRSCSASAQRLGLLAAYRHRHHVGSTGPSSRRSRTGDHRDR